MRNFISGYIIFIEPIESEFVIHPYNSIYCRNSNITKTTNKTNEYLQLNKNRRNDDKNMRNLKNKYFVLKWKFEIIFFSFRI